MTLQEFLAKHVKPYDPATDTYRREPFSKSTDNANKASAIYNMHMYWTKQDPYVVREFIEHYTEPGDVVLDAFCGTGMTGVAAMLCRKRHPDGRMSKDGTAPRHAILFDLSPACVHIARNYTTPVDPRDLERAFRALMDKVEPEVRPLYRTKCHRCGNPEAQIANTILSDVFRCPHCNRDVVFAEGGRWDRMKRGEKVERIECECGWKFRKADAEFVRVEPVEIRVDCDRCRAKGQAKCRPLDQEDRALYRRIEGEDIPCWYPKDVRLFGDVLRKKQLRDGFDCVHKMFSRRNLRALSVIWHYINESANLACRDKLRFVFTAGLYKASLMCRWKVRRVDGRINEDGIGPYSVSSKVLYIPSLIAEKNAVDNIVTDFQKILKGEDSIYTAHWPANHKPINHVEIGDARRLQIPDGTVDYAYYDPPYGANINYSELNIMWEAWVGQFTDISREIVENRYQRKTRREYERMMTTALKECYRVLKPGRWLTVVYSYSDASMYRTVQRMAHEAGYIDEGEILYVGSGRLTHCQMQSHKVQQRYLVINFYKPHNGERKALAEAEHFEDEVVRAIHGFLREHSGATRDRIYDECIRRTFSETQIKGFDLDALLKQEFQPLGDGWQTAGAVLKDREAKLLEEDVKTVQDVMLACQQHLGQHGAVPIHQFREFYQLKLGAPEFVDFDDLLASFKVEAGRLRLPTPKEQEELADINRLRTRRHIRRVVEGKDLRYVDDKSLCDWIAFCYREEMFAEAVALFPLINDTQLDADTYRATEDVVKVCRKRLKEAGEPERRAQPQKARAKRDGKLFEA